MVNSEDTSRAGLGGEIGKLSTSVKEGLEAVVAQANVALSSGQSVGGWVANSHAETLEDC